MERKKVTDENSYFLKELETLSIEVLKNLQFEKTKETLRRAYYKSDFYRRRFDAAGLPGRCGRPAPYPATTTC
jgi:phenylacetate-coenzyme A ligase PaaK-like adenylate-forming protein